MCDYIVQRSIREETQVERSRRRNAGLDRSIEARRMHVELVRSESERDALRAVALDRMPRTPV